MADVIKVLSNEISVNTVSSDVDNASLVRIVNFESSTNLVITQKNAANTTIARFTLGKIGSDSSCINLAKSPTDTIETSSDGLNIKAVSIAFY